MSTSASADADKAHDPHRPNVKVYLIVFGILMVMTVVTVLVSYLHLTPMKTIALGLAIATFKASLVAFYFMHLKDEKPLIYGLLLLSAFFLLFLYLIPIIDSHLLSGQTVRSAPTGVEGAGEGKHVDEGIKQMRNH